MTQSLRILVAGGTGFVGSALCRQLQAKGHEVKIISRNFLKNGITFQEIREKGLPKCDAVAVLTGSNLMEKSWTTKRKQELKDSRIGVTNLLIDAMLASKDPPKTFVSASAIGIYPTSETKEYDEYYSPQHEQKASFGRELYEDWEKAVQRLDKKQFRTGIVRLGVVIGPGGVLSKLHLPFSLGLGGKTGNGQQFMPWVHIDDASGIFQFILENPQISGVLNAVAPQISKNAEFTKALGRAEHRWTFLNIPEWAVKVGFGERSELVLKGQKVIPKRTLELGYHFKFTNLQDAINDALRSLKNKE